MHIKAHGKSNNQVYYKSWASCVCGRFDAANFRPCRFLSGGGDGVGGCVIMLIYSKAPEKKAHGKNNNQVYYKCW